jgi:hypothetical protein
MARPPPAPVWVPMPASGALRSSATILHPRASAAHSAARFRRKEPVAPAQHRPSEHVSCDVAPLVCPMCSYFSCINERCCCRCRMWCAMRVGRLGRALLAAFFPSRWWWPSPRFSPASSPALFRPQRGPRSLTCILLLMAVAGSRPPGGIRPLIRARPRTGLRGSASRAQRTVNTSGTCAMLADSLAWPPQPRCRATTNGHGQLLRQRKSVAGAISRPHSLTPSGLHSKPVFSDTSSRLL